MANVYWHGDGGNWSDFTNHWFNATDGGGGSHGAAPGTDDNAIFDLNSFDSASQTVTVDATASCLDMDWTGATNNPTLGGSSLLNIYGSLTFIAAMTVNRGGAVQTKFYGTGAATVTLNGQALGDTY